MISVVGESPTAIQRPSAATSSTLTPSKTYAVLPSVRRHQIVRAGMSSPGVKQNSGIAGSVRFHKAVRHPPRDLLLTPSHEINECPFRVCRDALADAEPKVQPKIIEARPPPDEPCPTGLHVPVPIRRILHSDGKAPFPADRESARDLVLTFIEGTDDGPWHDRQHPPQPRTRRAPHRSGEQPGSAAGAGEESHGDSVADVPRGCQRGLAGGLAELWIPACTGMTKRRLPPRGRGG